jgi:N-acetylmuramoyl-L-alanine amidase
VILAVVLAAGAVTGLALVGGEHNAPGRRHDTIPVPIGGMALEPGQFASGACVAYAPTVGDRHETVFLDAGHGGIDPGAVGMTTAGQTIYEADATLPVELDTMALLRAEGFRVVVSRTTDSTVARLGRADSAGSELTLQGSHDDVAARAACADDAEARVLVGIYFDAGLSAQDAGSLTAYDAARSFSNANLALATLLQDDVLTAMNGRGWGIPDAGVQDDTMLGSFVGDPQAGGIAGAAASYDHLLLLGPAAAGFFSQPSRMPGAVIEPLFVTDPFEASIAANASDQAVIAGGIAHAVEQFLIPPVPSGGHKDAAAHHARH